MDNIITIKNVSKSFGSQLVIDNISAEFERGKIHGIIGRNGSGKTVLLKMICGLVYTKIGSIKVNNKVIGKDVDFPDNIGIIIEAPGFLHNRSGLKNLLHLASFHRKIAVNDIVDVMEKVGLDSTSKKNVGKYSLGMRQRLGIAQAIMENPVLLIMDEPFNGLDEYGINDMRSLFLELKDKGTTILIATHIKEDVNKLCDTIFKISSGKLKQVK